jgi:hypothetical protein
VSLGSRLWLSSLYRTVRTVLRNWLRLWVGLCGGFSDQCCASTTLSIFHAGMKGRAEIPPEAGTTLAFAHSAFRGNCMGEILLLLSCGAAFITGLVIVAVSLFS